MSLIFGKLLGFVQRVDRYVSVVSNDYRCLDSFYSEPPSCVPFSSGQTSTPRVKISPSLATGSCCTPPTGSLKNGPVVFA